MIAARFVRPPFDNSPSFVLRDPERTEPTP